MPTTPDALLAMDEPVDPLLASFVDFQEVPEPLDPQVLAREHVVAVLVTHDGERWLPQTLQALAPATGAEPARRPDAVVAVDTGSGDATPTLLRRGLTGRPGQVHRVIELATDTAYGAAVAAGVAAAGDPPADRPGWLWLLHDDCVPAPGALEALLGCALRDPRIAVVGPKVRGWADDRRLLELGVSLTGGGRRWTGLERRETDQGQHDRQRRVLAVGSAGMLVRRDVWDELGGFDAELPFFRDDVDFGWRANLAGHRVVVCPDAVVRHAEAVARGSRRLDVAGHSVPRMDRRNAMFVLLANASRAWVAVELVRLLVGSLLRALGLLLGKQPVLAGDELTAAFDVLGRPGAVRAARAARRPLRRVSAGELHDLFPPRGHSVRHGAEVLMAAVRPPPADPPPSFGAAAGLPAQAVEPVGRPESVAEPAYEGAHAAARVGVAATNVPLGGDIDEVPETGSVLRGVTARPGLLLAAVAAVVALLAARDLIGAGRLSGGALLPVRSGAGSLLSAYAQGWHPVGLGSDVAAAPYLALVGALGLPLLGSAPLVVDLLLLASVPLATATAYLALRHVLDRPWLRAAAAATYGLLPGTLGAVAAGRLGTCVALVLLPLVALVGARAVVADTLRPAWAGGLLLAVVAAYAPQGWVIALLAAVVAVAWVRTRAAAVRVAVVVGVPVVLLLPWSWRVVAEPWRLAAEPGLVAPALSTPVAAPWSVLLGDPGGPGAAPAWLSALVVAGALAALLGPYRRATVLLAWTVALGGAALALVVVRTPLPGSAGAAAVPGWPGLPCALVWLGLLVAAAVGAEGLLARSRGVRSPRGRHGLPRLPGRSDRFDRPERPDRPGLPGVPGVPGLPGLPGLLRYRLGAGLAVVALLTPLVAAGWWVGRGAGDPLRRQDPDVLPAYVAEDVATPARPRALVVQRRDGAVTYAVLRAAGPRLGDADLDAPPSAYGPLDRVVADLVAGRGADDADRLAAFAIGYVYLPAPADSALIAAIDGVADLVRASSPAGGAIWQVDRTVARVRAVAGDRVTVVPSGPVQARGTVEDPGGVGDATVVLAEPADPRWRASVDGEPLAPRSIDGWAQGFDLPHGGAVEVTYAEGDRLVWLLVQGIALLVVIGAALPSLRREPDRLDDVPVLIGPARPGRGS